MSLSVRSLILGVAVAATLLLSWPGAQGQQEKPDAAVTPVAAIGAISEGEKRIILARLEADLSKQYRLIPREEYARAEERAFREIEASKCTEEACFRKIQELLQVERIFALQIIREGALTQVSLSLIRPADKFVEEDACERCTIGEVRTRIEALVRQVFAADAGAPRPPSRQIALGSPTAPRQTVVSAPTPTPQQARHTAPPIQAVIAAPPSTQQGSILAQPAQPAGNIWREPVTGMEFVSVPGGTFEMGCGTWTKDCDADEKPTREVRLSAFWIGRTEVTQGQWKQVMGDHSTFFHKGEDYPVGNVGWEQTQEFIERLNARSSGFIFRLPTEAEWEFACRAGGRPVAFGTETGNLEARLGNFLSGSGTEPVARFPPNALGLHDMSGNVWEWVQDQYDASAYRTGIVNSPIVEGSGVQHVFRGGSWNVDSRHLRCSYRHRYVRGLSLDALGFRLARNP